MNWQKGNSILLILCIVSGLFNLLKAQSRYDSTYAELAKQHPEKLIVFTDRTLYAVNEPILFSAFLQTGTNPRQEVKSEVLYMELLKPGGDAIVKSKFLISDNSSSGYISIPSNLTSGNYYLRSYTRWMRNFGAQHFYYIPIQIVNPLSREEQGIYTDNEKTDLIKIPPDHQRIAVAQAKRSYEPGEQVAVEFSLLPGTINQVQNACITVVPAGCIDTAYLSYEPDWETDAYEQFQFNYLPDRNGGAISGTIFEKNSVNSVSNIPVHFSILGENPAYYITRSDPGGNFLINIPHRTGDQEMIVVPEQQRDLQLDVRIENDFSTDPLPFRVDTFRLHPDQKHLASRLSLHMQLQLAYMSKSGTDSMNFSKPSEQNSFYGLPEISVQIDEYINLPNMEEVIENLVPRTAVIRRKGSPYLIINSNNPLISVFHPLLLIDHIPVFDTEHILAIPPSKIDHIEVVPEVYVKGELKYGGIISFHSRKGDLAGINLPEGSYFFDYSSLQSAQPQEIPRYKGNGRIPDTRNTLFWKSGIELKKDRTAKIGFTAASIPGRYLILFRGLTSDGRIIHGADHINVE